MKKILLILFFFSLTIQSFSQTTWFSQNSGITTKHFNKVQFINELTGFIVGDTSAFLKTTNGGVNWNIIPLGFTINIKCVHFFDSLTGVIGGGTALTNFPVFLKTTNGGINWSDSPCESPGIPLQFSFTTPTTGYSVGGFGNPGEAVLVIRKTINGGNSWSSQYDPGVGGSAMVMVSFASQLTGFAGSTSGDIWRTTNGGINWIEYTTSQIGYPTQISFPNATTGFMSTAEGRVLKTTNTGATWVLQNVLGTNDPFNSICFTSPEVGYAVGYLSTIVKTTNGGLNWEANASPSLNTLNSVVFVNSVTGYAVGNKGTIIKTTSGGLTFLDPVNTNVPDKFSLYQNYPNPFNPSTTIKFDIGKPGYTTVRVFDLQGKEVERLISANLNAGEYEINFSGERFSSGIYYYRIESGSYRETRKMILMK